MATEIFDIGFKDINNVPKIPFYISPLTTVTVYETVGTIINNINELFIDNKYVSAQWNNFTYTLVYLNKEIRCKIEINIFDCKNGSFLLEINRNSGDSFMFINMYKEIKNAFEGEKLEIIDYSFNKSVIKENSKSLSIGEKELELILKMAFGKYGDEIMNASIILCRILSTNNEINIDFSIIVNALKHLTTIKFKSCNEYAWGALESISLTENKKLIISNPELVHSLLELCSNGLYETIPMRRVCSNILSNIICDDKTCVEIFLSIVNEELMLEWLESVDKLEDRYVREQSINVKNELKCFMDCKSSK
jgi:hypothetical protein